MNRKKSNEQFMKEAREIHNDFYDYSLTNYSGCFNKIKVICPKHGAFEIIAANHLNGQGCRKCGQSKANKKNSLTQKEFIEKAKLIHNNFYDYSLVNYTIALSKIKIICPIHGVFEQRAESHLQGNGCPKCSGKKITKEEFINEAKLIHNDFYNYELVDFKNKTTKVKIICPIHGVFEQTPSIHINQKHGCPKCKASFGEREIRRYLKENNILFEEQKKFSNLKDIKCLSFDFYLSEKNLLIEYNGRQHYEEVFKNHSLKIQRHHDWLKRKYAKDKGFNLLTIGYKDDIIKLLKGSLNGAADN